MLWKVGKRRFVGTMYIVLLSTLFLVEDLGYTREGGGRKKGWFWKVIYELSSPLLPTYAHLLAWFVPQNLDGGGWVLAISRLIGLDWKEVSSTGRLRRTGMIFRDITHKVLFAQKRNCQRIWWYYVLRDHFFNVSEAAFRDSSISSSK